MCIRDSPQVDLLDENLQPERELLEFTHHNSPFFSAVLFLDGNGVPVWSEPRGALPALSRGRDRWFQRMLRTDRPVVDALEAVSYTHLRAHETPEHLVCRLLLEKKK